MSAEAPPAADPGAPPEVVAPQLGRRASRPVGGDVGDHQLAVARAEQRADLRIGDGGRHAEVEVAADASTRHVHEVDGELPRVARLRERERAPVRGEVEPAVRAQRRRGEPAGDRVHEQDGRGVVLDRQGAAVGADRVGVRAVAGAGQDADRGGVAQQLGEQRAARGDRVVERRARAGEQQPVVDAVVGQRLGAEALGVGDDRRVARGAALGERDGAGHDRGGQQHGDAGHRRPQAAVGAALAVGLVGGVGAGGRDELVLERVQLAGVGVAPLRGGSEPRAAIELCGIAAARGPVVRGARQVGVQPAALGIRPRSRPAAGATRAAAPRAPLPPHPRPG